jgi:putative tricarboxylic transport membrane protein
MSSPIPVRATPIGPRPLPGAVQASPACAPRRAALRGLAALGGAGALGLPSIARADWKPSRTLTWTLGVAPGGSVDLYARAIAAALTEAKLLNGQSIVVENKPGAAGLLALQVLARNAGDAHHLGTFHTGGIAGAVSGALKADVRDYPPVAMMVEESTFAIVGTGSPLASARELIAALRADPASLRIAVAPAPGQNTHLAIAKPLKAAGIDVRRLTIVPFRSSGDSMTALVGGHVDLVSATGPAMLPHLARVRALAVASPRRAGGDFAQVPTWREQGVPVDYLSYNGVCLPAGCTVDQIRFWEDALRAVSASASWKALVLKSGNTPVFLGYVDAKRYLDREWADTQALLGELGLAGVGR